MAQPVIAVRGLSAFRRDLRTLGREYRVGLDRELRKTAQPIARDAQRRYRALHPRRRGTRGSQRGIRHQASGGAVRMLLGGARYPYLQGQEFGSTGRYPQFPERNPTGHFFYPAIRSGVGGLMQRLEDVVDRANALHFGS